jgi:magnesium-protoporphyrin O-methyltransferase
MRPDMSCCLNFGDAAEHHFTEQIASSDLAGYRAKGPGPTTRLLVDVLSKAGQLEGLLLDVGTGIGALTFELLERGISRAVALDASSAYVAAAREEAASRGYADVIRFVHGDFLGLASELPPARVVTLDRVICCYPDYEPLLEEALRHTERCFALSYPKDCWYVRTVLALENGHRRLSGKAFRTYVHPAARIDEIISRSGFQIASHRQTWMWSDVYTAMTYHCRSDLRRDEALYQTGAGVPLGRRVRGAAADADREPRDRLRHSWLWGVSESCDGAQPVAESAGGSA